MLKVFSNYKNAERGVQLHALAKKLIDLRIKLPPSKNSFNMFVNDGIGFNMDTEFFLFYSPYCYGTADSIAFDNNTLRIHDLKTGDSGGNVLQLLVYAALFCLQYDVKPESIYYDLRIYHGDTYTKYVPGYEDVRKAMLRISELTLLLTRQEAEYNDN